jgi:glycerol kinase
MQQLAELGGRPVLRAAEAETTAIGAALLAGLAVGVFANPAACRDLSPPAARFDPRGDPARRAEARARWRVVLERAREGDAAG